MVTKKEGPIARAIKALGLGKTSGGGSGGYRGCWACANGRCGSQFDNTCSCCRSRHR